jgi:hypothetical protein
MLLTEGEASGRDARRQGCAQPTTRHPPRA